MNDLKTKIIVGSIIAVMLSLLIFCIFTIIDLKKEIATNQTNNMLQMKQLQDNLVRGSHSYVDEEELLKTLDDMKIDMGSLQKDLDSLDAKISAINVMKVVTPGGSWQNLPSNSTKPNPNPTPPSICDKDGNCINPDKFGYLNNSQTLILREPIDNKNTINFGDVTFSAWRKEPWDLNIRPREYSVTTIISKDEDGKNIVHNQMAVTVDGKTTKLPIKESKTLEKIPESSFHFDPTLALGLGIGALVYPTPQAEVIPMLEVSFFSYGETKVNPELTFLGVGIGVHTQVVKPAIVLSPVNYNLGKPIPFIDNLQIGPTLSVDIDGNVGVSGSLKVEL